MKMSFADPAAKSKGAAPDFVRRALLVLLCALCLLNAGPAFAAVSVSTTQNSQLSFGTLQTPGSNTSVTIATNGSVSGGGVLLFGTQAAGNYTITCTSACGSVATVDVNVSVSTAGCTGLTSLTSLTGDLNGTAITFPKTGFTWSHASPTLVLKVGATANFTSSATAQQCTPSISVIVTPH